jgi:aspartyl-tRNA(Asn)/glutamyl-tRNA(Gln) amidotransferase subunit A
MSVEQEERDAPAREGRGGEGETPLWRLPLLRLSALIDRGEVSPSEILAQVLERVADAEPRINAFRHLATQEAIAAANAATARALRGERLGALDGLPLHVKDNIFVRGMPASWGSVLYEGFAPEKDDLPVAAMRRAGAVIFGKTNTPEFALLGRTESRIAGVTRNPWDTAQTPGGSSGGAAAAVAAGMGPAGLATDAAGSIRRPAAYCGVVGFRPSLDAVPRRYGFPATAHDLQTIGPITTTVADARLLFETICTGGFARERGLPTRRIALVVEDAQFALDSQVRQAVEELAATLCDHGYAVEPVGLPWKLGDVEEVWARLSSAGAARIAAAFDVAGWREKATPAMQDLARRGTELTAAEYVLALDELQRLRQEAEDWFSRFDYLITPSSPCVAWAAEEAYPVQIGGREAGPRAAAVFATAVNVCGLPAISLPAGFHDGLPIGLQVIGPRGDDRGALDLAARLEAGSGVSP